MDDTGHFIMVVSFSRHNFRLDEDSVAAALESAIGGSAIDLSVQLIKDKVFSFIVSCKRVGLLILQLRSSVCPQFNVSSIYGVMVALIGNVSLLFGRKNVMLNGS